MSRRLKAMLDGRRVWVVLCTTTSDDVDEQAGVPAAFRTEGEAIEWARKTARQYAKEWPTNEEACVDDTEVTETPVGAVFSHGQFGGGEENTVEWKAVEVPFVG